METKSSVTSKSDDPAFLYFPTNYRWSMGLLICLSGAPWMGVEIDEVNRVGRALARGHKLTAASCFMRACRYYQTGERFIQPRSQHSMDVYAKSVRIFKEA